MIKIRNAKGSWAKLINRQVKLWVENSAWDGSPEYIESYVAKITEKGVWFSSEPECANDHIYWLPFLKIKGYLEKIN